MEVFERTDSATVFWGQLALPDVVVRARAPFEYTYYLDLNKTWELTLKKKSTVTVPTPAIDVSEFVTKSLPKASCETKRSPSRT